VNGEQRVTHDLPFAIHYSQLAAHRSLLTITTTAMKQFIIISLLCFVAAGCGRSDVPGDLPKLYPCAITVTQNGAALPGAGVQLVSQDESAKYRIATGTTDDSGLAEIRTYGFAGVPLGTYKVIVTKTITEDVKEYVDEVGSKQLTQGTDYSTVEIQYTDEKSTPLTIEITDKDKATATFDVGKAVKVKL
jgi:hypothetical protein